MTKIIKTKRQIVKTREIRAIVVEIMQYKWEGVNVHEVSGIIDGFTNRLDRIRD